MATVQGPNIPTHAVDSRKRARAFQQIPTAPQPKADPYYGHEIIARLCTRFITHLFACPEYPPTATQTQAKLPYFIAYALHRTKLHASVTFAALVLLQRLKARFPTARGSSGHRLFISAFMIASKVICDDTYSNKSWGIVAQGMFNLREINQMEREMCSYLDWELTVDNPILENFEKMVRQDFATSGPYPTYSLQMVSKRAVKAAASTSATPIPEPHATTTAIPSFDTRHPTPVDNTPAYTAHTRSPASPMTPDTPSYSNSTSPASSASPQTPVGGDEWSNPKIATVDSHPYTMLRKPRMVSTSNPSKSKTFAFAQPAAW